MDRLYGTLFVTLIVCLLASVTACQRNAQHATGDESLPADSVYAAAVQQQISNAPSYLRSDEALHSALKRFYQRRDYRLAFGDEAEITLAS